MPNLMKRLWLLSLACMGCLSAAAQSEDFKFIENKGQWARDVLLAAQAEGGAFSLHKDGYTFSLVHPQDLSLISAQQHARHTSGAALTARATGPDSIRVHTFRVRLIGANPHATIVPEKPEPDVNNYFTGNDPAKWGSGCRIFRAVRYENIYPGIDLRYFSGGGKLKSEFIVHPGADVAVIRLQYDGVDGLSELKNQLHVKLSVGELVESQPYSYQPGNDGRITIGCRYAVKDRTVQFNVKHYDRRKDLVIDPQYVFSTFTGGTGNTWGFTATNGKDGSFYSGGIALTSGFSVTPGVVGPTFHPVGTAFTSDIAVIKFSPDGKRRIWATYIGGDRFDQPHSMFEDADGNLVIAGRTNSTDYPVTQKVGPGGGYDIVVTKLNSTATALIGSLQIGGGLDEAVNIKTNYMPSGTINTGATSLMQNYSDDARSEVVVGPTGAIYLAACTASDDFPVRGAAFQPVKNAVQDAVILKIDNNCSSVIWSSFFGGNKDDAAYVIAINPVKQDQLLIGGGTVSTDLPVPAGAPVVQPAYQGGVADGFVALLTDQPAGVTLDKVSYLGTNGTDQVYGVQYDQSGHPYVMGTTTGTWPVINAAFSNANARQFIAKLMPDLSSYVYSTTYGVSNAATPNISPGAFLVDDCENVYISGWGGGINSRAGYPITTTTGMPVTADALQSTTDGNDFYFFVLAKNAVKQLYGSFFGSVGGNEHVDGGTSRFDRSGVIYQAICAGCDDVGSIYTYPSDVWAPRERSTVRGSCDIASLKIAFLLSGVKTGVKSTISNTPGRKDGCVPLEVTFKDTIANAKQFQWDFGDGSPEVVTDVPEVKHTYTQPGTFTVRLIGIDVNACKERDTSWMEIRARDDKVLLSFNIEQIMPCADNKFLFKNTTPVLPGRTFNDTSFIWDFGDGVRQKAGLTDVTHAYNAAGIYKVKLVLEDTGYCNSPDSIIQNLNVLPLVKAAFAAPTGPFCIPYTAQLLNQSANATDFRWTFGDGAASTAKDPVHTYTAKGQFRIQLIARNEETCNKEDMTERTITLEQPPNAAFSWGPQPPKENTPTEFTNLTPREENIRFKWLFGDGDSLVTSSYEMVTHQYIKTGKHTACLVATNAAGCESKTCLDVTAIVNVVVDVPNAFAPGRPGINRVLKVRGFGIAKMRFAIYNRWGQQVFVSNNQQNGWDGMFNGTLQPMDVYVYTLEVTFSDDTKVVRHGDITLIR